MGKTLAEPPGRLRIRPKLDPAEVAPILSLVDRVRRHDGCDPGPDTAFVRGRALPVPTPIESQTVDLLWEVDDVVVAYGATYGFGGRDIEMVVAVDPKWRRQGIGTRLVTAAFDVARAARVSRFLAVVPRLSPAGHAVAVDLHGEISHSEASMVLVEPPPSTPDPGAGLVAREANATDLPILGGIGSQAFGSPFAEAVAIARSTLGFQGRTTQIFALDGADMAMISVAVDGTEASIAGFAVLPTLQGRGYGRAILTWVAGRLASAGLAPISIDVDVTNARAGNLYRAVGFRETRIFDYYAIPLP